MNPEKPSREDIEAKLTALLLGELSAEEATLLRWAISQDAALAQLHDRLKLTVGFVREVAANPAETTVAQSAPLKLSDERREKLLAHFKTVRPIILLPPLPPKRREVSSFLVMAAALALIAVLAAMLLPSLAAAKRKAQHITMLSASMEKAQAPAAPAAPQAASEQRLESAEAQFQNGNLTGNGGDAWKNQTPIVLPAGETENKGLAAADSETPDDSGLVFSSANYFVGKTTPAINGALPPNNAQAAGGIDFALSASSYDNNGSIGGRGGSSFGGGGGGGGGASGNFQQRLQSAIQRRANSETGDTVAFDGTAKQDGFNFDTSKSDLAQNEPKNGGGFYTGATKDDVNGLRDLLAPQSSVAQNQAVGERKYYRVQAEPDATADKTPMPGDVPVMGNLFASSGQANQAANSWGSSGGSIQAPVVNSDGIIQQPSAVVSSVGGTADWNGNLGAPKNNGEEFRRNSPVIYSDGRIQTPVDMGAVGTEPSTTDADAKNLAMNGDVWTKDEIKNEIIRRVMAHREQAGQNGNQALGFDWYLGSFSNGTVAASGGSTPAPAAPTSAASSLRTITGILVAGGGATISGGSEASQDVPASAANPLGKFPGNTTTVVVAPPPAVPSGDFFVIPTVAPSAVQPQGGDYSASVVGYVSATNGIVLDREVDSSAPAPIVAPTAPVTTMPSPTVFLDRKLQLGADAYAGQQAELQSKNIQLNYASPSNIQSSIQSSLTDNRSKVVVDSRTGELAMTGTPQDIQSAENLVSQLDKPSRQMLVENVAGSGGWLGNVTSANEAAKKAEAPKLYTRTFKIDPNTFYQGLQNVGTSRFGSANNNGGVRGGGGGLNYITSVGQMEPVSAAAQTFFKSLGVDLSAPGKNIFFNDRLGQLFVRGSAEDLDTIQSAVQTITNSPAAAPVATDVPLPKTPSPAPIPQPEFLTGENPWSTFSLNVSDVSYKLAAASLEKGQLPDASSIRSEEFINAFDYHDPEPAAGVPVAFVSERARDPFTQNRDLLRFSIKTAAAGREAGRPLNIVLLLDNSGSMERADRVAIIHEALKVLASQLQPQDTLSIVTFARTARLWVDGARGDQAGTVVNEVSNLTPEGGTNLEDALNLAYATARRHYLAQGVNRVVLLTDGAANLGNVDPEALKQKVESFRKQGIALDCFGIGWEGYNDDLLEVLSSNGDGRYGFINTPEAATTEFAAQLAGALHVAAEDVKVQVEFNPQRVISWRQIGYAKHQLTKEQFRDNTVAAAPMAAREAGNALYTVEINPQGSGPVATVRVRFRVPGTTDVSEHEWEVPFDGTAPALENSSPAMRLAATAGEFSEWLASSPFAQEVTTDQLLNDLNGVPQIYGADPRPKQLETMIREAKSLSGK